MIKKDLLLTCSGGETSMFMVIWCWMNLQEFYNMKIVFVNTGQEQNKTLDFVKRCQDFFKLPINWIESRVFHDRRKSSGYYMIDYECATRSDDYINTEYTPFEQVIKKYGIPNHSRLHCTRELKMNPIKAFGRFSFDKKYYLALGIRSDEFDRINKDAEKLRIIYPLISKEMQPMTKKHINFWWSQQPFRLELKGYQGNCITCYKKSNNKLYQIAQEQPEAFRFNDFMEIKYGNQNGLVPQKLNSENVLEQISTKEYKNVFFRGFKSAKEVLETAMYANVDIIDDHIETESCEIFSACGE